MLAPMLKGMVQIARLAERDGAIIFIVIIIIIRRLIGSDARMTQSGSSVIVDFI